MGVRCEVLGSVRLWRGDRQLSVPTAKPLTVLAVLLAGHGRPVRSEEIIDIVWPDAAPASATNLVQKYVGQLRSLLRAEGVLPFVEGGYVVDASVDLDLGWFRSQVRRSQRLEDRVAVLDVLLPALRVWRGPAFATIPPQVRAQPVFQAIDDEYVAAALRAADLAEAVGRHEQVLPALNNARQWRPLDESVVARWLVALAGVGRQAEALHGYREVRERLSEELGIDPGPQLQQAHRLVLRQQWTVVSGVRDAVVPRQLPAAADLAGRQSEARRLIDLLASPRRLPGAPPICVIIGQGGVGKTALALHVGHRLATAFPDGCLYADLRGGHLEPARSGQVLAAMLHALGVAVLAIPVRDEQRSELYRSLLADRKILVVLDDAADEAQVRPLLPGAGGCAVLITSRSSLAGLEGARPLRLGVLEQQHAIGLLASVVGQERTAAEPAAAAAIARYCGQLPLALQIAAARLADDPQWPLSTLAGRLADGARRLDELTRGDVAVRDTLAMSYRRLAAPARRCLRLLALLGLPDVAPWTVAAVLGAGLPDAEDIVAELARAHLVGPAGPATPGRSRYRMHELVRSYGQERCRREDSSADRRAAVARAAAAWLAACSAADSRLASTQLVLIHGPAWTGDDGPPGLDSVEDPADWFRAEQPNHAALVRRACDLGLTTHAWDLAASAVNLYHTAHLLDEWQHSHELCRTACQTVGDRFGEAVLERNLTELHYLRPQGQPAEAAERLSRAADLFASASEPRGQADVLVQMAVEQRIMGNLDMALAHAGASLDIATAQAYRRGQAQARRVIASIHLAAGRHPDAVDSAGRARDIARDAGCRTEEADCLHLLGCALAKIGDDTAAAECLRAAADLHRACHATLPEMRVRLTLGTRQARTGQKQRARQALTHCLSFFTQIGAEIDAAKTRSALAAAEYAGNTARGAVTGLEQALETWRKLGNLPEQASLLNELGRAYARTGDHTAAARAHHQARALDIRLGNLPRTGEIDAPPPPAPQAR